MKKYFFYNSVYAAHGTISNIPQVGVLENQHPFEWIHRLNKIEGYENYLLSWQEITEEEFLMYKRLIEDE